MNVQLATKTLESDANKTQRHIDILVSVLWIACLLPIALLNSVIAALVGKKPLISMYKTDAMGRVQKLHVFSTGVLKDHAIMFDVLKGDIALCGVPFTTKFTIAEAARLQNTFSPKAGLISAFQVCQYTGFSFGSPANMTSEQLSSGNKAYLALIVKYVFCRLFYPSPTTNSKETVSLFGLSICNTTMRGAVKKVMSAVRSEGKAKTFCFINAHSVNQMARHPRLIEHLNNSDTLFADGSGMRVAAQRAGVVLQDNVNGTDMLPALCEQAEIQGKRLFLLGAKPGVADKMAKNLKAKHPALEISGTQHGYFSQTELPEIIDTINTSDTDILLVAFGSPIQEAFLADNASALQCSAVLAVGGLFDFYSGNIARAPLAMRQLGLEWIWRLMQEPKAKFTRYVVGTPEFLFRTYLTNQVSKGI